MQTLPVSMAAKVSRHSNFALPLYVQLLAIFLGLATAASVANANSLQFRGNIKAEARYFIESAPHSTARQSNVSLAAEPEFYYALAEGNSSLSLTPFLRWDENDPARSHVDLRELNWHKIEQSWELTLGVNRVFWGVTETVHLVNIINQVDLVENPDQEDLLGQAMANLTLIRNWG
ncbi:MAG: hypothetical protein KJO24_04460, partial [Gammaproteobacteria bacterium]|nr:hypothetical protein [Gammaproteobacteria bacterium]